MINMLLSSRTISCPSLRQLCTFTIKLAFVVEKRVEEEPKRFYPTFSFVDLSLKSLLATLQVAVKLTVLDFLHSPCKRKWFTYNPSSSSFRSLQLPPDMISMCWTISRTNGLTNCARALRHWQSPCWSSCSCCFV